MNDRWSRFNEFVQNVLALAVVASYLYMVVNKMQPPIELIGFTGAILIFFGFKAYKSKGNGTTIPPEK